MLDVLREMCPDSGGDAELMLANHIKVNGGAANAGDVVSCTLRGEKVMGELLVSVVVTETGAETPYSFISMWTMAADDLAWPYFLVSDDQVIKVPMAHVKIVHTYSMASDRTTCLVYDP